MAREISPWEAGVLREEEEQRQATALRLEELGKQILSASRDELYMGMRFLDVALSSFVYQGDASVQPFGTDGYGMYYNPRQLCGLYKENRILVNRGYLHMVFHCIFRHMTKPIETGSDAIEIGTRYWNLSCDIAVEHMIDGNFHRSVRYSRSLLRRETYRKLEASGKVLNAERIRKMLFEWELTEKELGRLEEEFYRDDHRYWVNQNPQQKQDPQLNQKWQEINERMETDLETFSKEASEKNGDLVDQLQIENRKRIEYQEFLRKFAVLREEVGIDADSFDYNFYSYGLHLYGNMPLIEPQETKEVKKIAEFVVVIDTSMSCSGELVRKFLEETYGVLTEQNSFFKKVNIHIIQCDEKVQSDHRITNEMELRKYMENLELRGEGGTDFRPAFSYVEELRQQGEFEDLRGLIYFTDGYGIYPAKKTDYETAFVFMQEDYRDEDVPPWAMKLILEEEWISDSHQIS